MKQCSQVPIKLYLQKQALVFVNKNRPWIQLPGHSLQNSLPSRNLLFLWTPIAHYFPSSWCSWFYNACTIAFHLLVFFPLPGPIFSPGSQAINIWKLESMFWSLLPFLGCGVQYLTSPAGKDGVWGLTAALRSRSTEFKSQFSCF